MGKQRAQPREKGYNINTVNSNGRETCAKSRKRKYYTLFQLNLLVSAGPSEVYFMVLKNWLQAQGLGNDYLQGRTRTSRRTNTAPVPNKKGGGNCKILWISRAAQEQATYFLMAKRYQEQLLQMCAEQAALNI